MEEDVHYKVILSEDENEEEVRRIVVRSSYKNKYFYLKQQIASSFPNLEGLNFKIHWKDEEGDNVRISSDSELCIVNKEPSLYPYKKLYITRTKYEGWDNSKMEESEDEDVKKHNGKFSYKKINFDSLYINKHSGVHSTVTCNGCNKEPVIGFRYKCLICYDYDLCIDCEKSQRIHTDHLMLRIPVPLSSEITLGKVFTDERNAIIQNLRCLLQD